MWATISAGRPGFRIRLARKVSEAEREGLDPRGGGLYRCRANSCRARAPDSLLGPLLRVDFAPKCFFPCYGLAEAALMVSGGPRGVATMVDPRPGRFSALEQHVVRDMLPGRRARLQLGGKWRAGAARPTSHDRHPRTTAELCPAAGGRPDLGAGFQRRGGILWPTGVPAESFGARLAGTGRAPFLHRGLGRSADGQLFVTARVEHLIIIRGQLQPPPRRHRAGRRRAHPNFHGRSLRGVLRGSQRRRRLVIVQELEPRTRTLDSEQDVPCGREAIFGL